MVVSNLAWAPRERMRDGKPTMSSPAKLQVGARHRSVASQGRPEVIQAVLLTRRSLSCPGSPAFWQRLTRSRVMLPAWRMEGWIGDVYSRQLVGIRLWYSGRVVVVVVCAFTLGGLSNLRGYMPDGVVGSATKRGRRGDGATAGSAGLAGRTNLTSRDAAPCLATRVWTRRQTKEGRAGSIEGVWFCCTSRHGSAPIHTIHARSFVLVHVPYAHNPSLSQHCPRPGGMYTFATTPHFRPLFSRGRGALLPSHHTSLPHPPQPLLLHSRPDNTPSRLPLHRPHARQNTTPLRTRPPLPTARRISTLRPDLQPPRPRTTPPFLRSNFTRGHRPLERRRRSARRPRGGRNAFLLQAGFDGGCRTGRHWRGQAVLFQSRFERGAGAGFHRRGRTAGTWLGGCRGSGFSGCGEALEGCGRFGGAGCRF